MRHAGSALSPKRDVSPAMRVPYPGPSFAAPAYATSGHSRLSSSRRNERRATMDSVAVAPVQVAPAVSAVVTPHSPAVLLPPNMTGGTKYPPAERLTLGAGETSGPSPYATLQYANFDGPALTLAEKAPTDVSMGQLLDMRERHGTLTSIAGTETTTSTNTARGRNIGALDRLVSTENGSARSGSSSVSPAVRGRNVWQARNEARNTCLQIVQQDSPGEGSGKQLTAVEVYDTGFSADDPLLLFSVEHVHSNLFGREMTLHKHILAACIIAGVESPVEIPGDSERMFSQTENLKAMHAFMEERMLPYFNYQNYLDNIKVYWWRALAHGAVILLHRLSGRVVILNNPHRTLPSAVETLTRLIGVFRRIPSSFLINDAVYPVEANAAKELDAIGENGSVLLHSKKVVECVEKWAESDEVSPYNTNFIHRTIHPQRKSQVLDIRYSLGIDPDHPKAICLQAHTNEPHSRSDKSFPLCIAPLHLASLRLVDVRLGYRQALWFLKKLFLAHREVDQLAAVTPPLMSEMQTSSGTSEALRTSATDVESAPSTIAQNTNRKPRAPIVAVPTNVGQSSMHVPPVTARPPWACPNQQEKKRVTASLVRQGGRGLLKGREPGSPAFAPAEAMSPSRPTKSEFFTGLHQTQPTTSSPGVLRIPRHHNHMGFRPPQAKQRTTPPFLPQRASTPSRPQKSPTASGTRNSHLTRRSLGPSASSTLGTLLSNDGVSPGPKAGLITRGTSTTTTNIIKAFPTRTQPTPNGRRRGTSI